MSRRRKKLGRRGRQRRQRRVTAWRVVGLVVIFVLGSMALAITLTIDAVGDGLRNQNVKEIRLGENTQIFDKNGRRLGRIAGVTNRTEVKRRSIPRHLEDATIAIEDKRFYEHDGVDYYRIVGAAVKDVRSGSTSQGALRLNAP